MPLKHIAKKTEKNTENETLCNTATGWWPNSTNGPNNEQKKRHFIYLFATPVPLNVNSGARPCSPSNCGALQMEIQLRCSSEWAQSKRHRTGGCGGGQNFSASQSSLNYPRPMRRMEASRAISFPLVGQLLESIGAVHAVRFLDPEGQRPRTTSEARALTIYGVVFLLLFKNYHCGEVTFFNRPLRFGGRFQPFQGS